MTGRISGWREGARFYAPPIVAGLLLFIPLWGTAYWWIAAAVVLIGCLILLFFRDPNRAIRAADNEIVSPADGRVFEIEVLESTSYYDGPCKRVCVFLSILNVHINRTPFDGTVRRVQYEPGAFMNALRAESSVKNESNTIWLETPLGPMTVRQITGAIARRIICRVGEGDRLETGERFGMIRFGSRTEVYLPCEADLCVTIGAKVKGGVTVVARFPTDSTIQSSD